MPCSTSPCRAHRAACRCWRRARAAEAARKETGARRQGREYCRNVDHEARTGWSPFEDRSPETERQMKNRALLTGLTTAALLTALAGVGPGGGGGTSGHPSADRDGDRGA